MSQDYYIANLLKRIEQLKKERDEAAGLNPGGYDYFAGRVAEAEKRATNANYVAEQLRAELTTARGTSNGVALIAAERRRQIEAEGWTPEHDDRHKASELACAAASYLAVITTPDEFAAERKTRPGPTDEWPWAFTWWKPSDDPVRNLVKAGALIAAEIDRRQRLQAKKGTRA